MIYRPQSGPATLTTSDNLIIIHFKDQQTSYSIDLASIPFDAAGNITLPSFSSTVTPSTDSVATVTDAGVGYTMTDGGVSQAADTKSGFATEGITATYVEATETLVFAAAGTAQAVTAAGAVTYTKPVLSGSLPTFGTKTVLTGAIVATTADGNATFAGTEADITPSLVNNAVISGTNVNPS